MSSNDDETGSSAVVDFDALNAALGALPPAPTSSANIVSDSEGRSSATYASARPHAIPATRAPNADPNTPAVIIQVDDTVQTGPPQMTMPRHLGMPISSSPHLAAASGPPSPFTPEPFAVQALPQAKGRSGHEVVNGTLRMGVERPRRHSSTLVVHTRGPTASQKFLVFIAMLVVVVGGGIAALVYYEPAVFNFVTHPTSRAPGITTVMTRGAPQPAVAPSGAGAAAASPSVAPSVAPSGAPASSTRKPRLGH